MLPYKVPVNSQKLRRLLEAARETKHADLSECRGSNESPTPVTPQPEARPSHDVVFPAADPDVTDARARRLPSPGRSPAADPDESGLCPRETLLRGLKATLSPSRHLTVPHSHLLTVSHTHTPTHPHTHTPTHPHTHTPTHSRSPPHRPPVHLNEIVNGIGDKDHDERADDEHGTEGELIGPVEPAQEDQNNSDGGPNRDGDAK